MHAAELLNDTTLYLSTLLAMEKMSQCIIQQKALTYSRDFLDLSLTTHWARQSFAAVAAPCTIGIWN